METAPKPAGIPLLWTASAGKVAMPSLIAQPNLDFHHSHRMAPSVDLNLLMQIESMAHGKMPHEDNNVEFLIHHRVPITIDFTIHS